MTRQEQSIDDLRCEGLSKDEISAKLSLPIDRVNFVFSKFDMRELSKEDIRVEKLRKKGLLKEKPDVDKVDIETELTPESFTKEEDSYDNVSDNESDIPTIEDAGKEDEGTDSEDDEDEPDNNTSSDSSTRKTRRKRRVRRPK